MAEPIMNLKIDGEAAKRHQPDRMGGAVPASFAVSARSDLPDASFNKPRCSLDPWRPERFPFA